ncbi:type II secretion system F family protein [Clostridium paraputrificum]|uniref:type II secretion system F family protein n=1 Tax=Clostridium paraputrificum TaxID=29363 RepID=UPI003D328659
MGVFKYEARNLDGVVINGSLEANSRSEVVENLRERQYYPLTIAEESTNILSKDITFMSKITVKDLALFCRQFGFILQSGTPILRGLELSMRQCENQRLKELLTRVHGQVKRGRAFSDALKFESEIPELMINMIAAGESSGKLDYVMNELSAYYTKQYKQTQKVNQATMYPKVVLVFAVVVVGFLLAFVVPQFVKSLLEAGGELPAPTKLLIFISNILKKTWFIIILIGFLIYGFKVYYLDKDEGYQISSGRRKLNGKLFGKINSQLVAGRFANTFAILNSSGLGIIQTMDIVSKVLENKYVERKLQQAKEDIKKGNAIGKTIEDLGIFPPMLTQMITVGEETGTMEDVLIKTSEYYDGETEAALAKMVSTIEPLLIIILAAIVLFIVLSLLLPMMNMMDAVNNMKK